MNSSSIKNKSIRFIPSQRIEGSNKEIFIIKYEGIVLEVQRTTNLYEPLIIRLNGELLDTIPSKQNKELEFSIDERKHKLQVWNERVENNLIPKIFVKDGIAIVIDGVPVQNTLADPISRFNSGKAILWLLTLLLLIKALLIPLSSNQFFMQGETNPFFFINIILFILSLSAALTFQLNPIRAVWIALVVSTLELTDYIFTVTMIKEIGIVVVLFMVLRLSVLASLIFSLRNLKLILNFSDEANQSVIEKQPSQKELKHFSFSFKHFIITIISLVIISGLFFVITEFIENRKHPSIERDSSLGFKTDLKLPELIPFRSGVKWGYANKKGDVIIEPRYSSVEFFSHNHAKVVFNDLKGIINNQGKEIIPCLYKNIDEFADENLFIVENKDGVVGVLDTKNKTVIPFDYERLEKHPSRELYIATKGKSGIIDKTNKTIIPFIYDGLEFCDEFLIARKQLKDKSYYGLLNYDGTILLNFQNLILSKNKNLKPQLIEASIERKIYHSLLSEFATILFDGIINSKGKIILPIEYHNISSLGKTKYLTITKKVYNPSFRSKTGVINSNGEIIIPCEYDDIPNGLLYPKENQKFIVVENDNLEGVIDFNNEIILPIQFEHISIQQQKGEYYFTVTDKQKNKAGLLRVKEPLNYYEIVIPFNYDRIYLDEKNNWITVWNNNRCGVIDFNNNIIVPIKYMSTFGISLSEGLAAVEYVDPDSIENVLELNKIKSDFLEEIHEGFIFGNEWIGIYRNPNYSYSNYTTLELINALSDTAKRRNYYEQNSKYLRVCPNYEAFCLKIITGGPIYNAYPHGKMGYFDKKGQLVNDFIYDRAGNFLNGLAEVKYNHKWGVINKKSEVVIPIKYNELERVKNFDLFLVKKNEGIIGLVDINGIEYFKN